MTTAADATRSLDAGDPAPPRVDHLYLALEAGRPTGGRRWSLAGVERVEIGRGTATAATRADRLLRVEIADPWMSSRHLRLDRERAHWVAADAGSRHGFAIGGVRQDRAALLGGDFVEAGRSFFALRTDEPVAAEPAAGDPLATLDPWLAERFAQLRRAAASTLPILVGGPTGAGKERVAREVHAASGRRGAFVAVNCAALPAALVESELFGHKRGAFSGAIADAVGLVVAASGGTLFLDEIGDLPPPAQAALLRVLEEHEVRAVGATAAVAVDLRVVAASHADLDELVRRGRFRDDLVARLTGFALELPPLRERLVDLGYMLAEIAPAGTQLSAAAARALFAYSWPRNVRELVRALERAVALAGPGVELAPAHLPEEVAAARFEPAAPSAGAGASPSNADGANGAGDAEPDPRRDELIALLAKHRGNVTQVAAELGKLRQQVQRWLKRYRLDPAGYRSGPAS